MAENATATPGKSHQFPKNGMNPLMAPVLVCEGRTDGKKCLGLMKPINAFEDPSTGQTMVRYHCDNPSCNYDFKLAPAYAQGEYAPPNSTTRRPPEVRERPTIER